MGLGSAVTARRDRARNLPTRGRLLEGILNFLDVALGLPFQSATNPSDQIFSLSILQIAADAKDDESLIPFALHLCPENAAQRDGPSSVKRLVQLSRSLQQALDRRVEIRRR